MSRRLVILRHAAAEAHASRDRYRELTPSGRAAAGEAGRWLREGGVRPDWALVSAARRTRSTWAEVATAAGWELTPAYDESLYEAGTDAALDLIRIAPAEIETLILVGHNPTVAALAHLLDDGAGDPTLIGAMATGFPPAAVAVLDVATDWADLGYACGTLRAFHRPG